MFKHFNKVEKNFIETNLDRIYLLTKYKDKSDFNIDLSELEFLLDLDLKTLNPNIVNTLKNKIEYSTLSNTLSILNEKNDEYLFQVYVYLFITDNFHINKDMKNQFINSIQTNYLESGNLSFEDMFLYYWDAIVAFLGINVNWKVGNELSSDSEEDEFEIAWILDTFKENINWALNSHDLLIVDLGTGISTEVLSIFINGVFEYDSIAISSYREHTILSIDYNNYVDGYLSFKSISNIALLLFEIYNLQKIHQ